MAKTITTEYTSEKYGTILIVEEDKATRIWLDPEQVMEGVELLDLNPNVPGYNEDGKWWADTFFEDVDFSDIPEGGLFKSFDEAKHYIESKLGKLE